MKIHLRGGSEVTERDTCSNSANGIPTFLKAKPESGRQI